MTTVVAIVPAKDRQDSVAETVRALDALEEIDRVLVVDDGSTDATSDRSRAAGAQVLRLGTNLGKGGAVAAGVEATPDADVYVLIDADVGSGASQAEALLRPVLDDEADLAIGVLPAAGKRGGFGLIRRFATSGIKRASGLEMRAALSGQRAIRAEFLRGMDDSARFGLEVAMTIDIARAGGRVIEVDVPMEHRHTGRSVSGFRHRASQGTDIVEALWPRVVPVWLRRVLLVGVVGGVLGLSLVTTRASAVTSVPSQQSARHVVIVGVPYFGFDDFDPETMPNLTRIAAQGATGKMTVRTGGGSASENAYATLGAGYRVSASSAAAQAAGRDSDVEGSPAIDVLERRTGLRPGGEIVVPALVRLVRGAGAHVDSRPGALGFALHRAGLRTAVIANSDTVDVDGEVQSRAPAALAVVSTTGAVDLGDVSHELLRPAPDRPFGVEMDDDRLLAAFDRVVGDAAVTVVDPGETDRTAWYSSSMRAEVAADARAAALTRTDDLLGSISQRLPDDSLLIVAGLSPPSGSAELLPVVLSGTGVVPGRLESPSTGRPGLVTLTDLAPTVLTSLGVEVPPGMVGQPLRYHEGEFDIAALGAENDQIQNRSDVYPIFQTSFVVVSIVVFVFALIALLRRDTPRGVRRLLRWAVVLLPTTLFMTFVLRAVPVLGSFGVGSAVLLYALAGLFSWFLAGRGRRTLASLVAIAWLGFVVLCADLATGAQLQTSSLLGYTPTVAARFGGIGNASYALLAASAVIVVAWIVDRSARPRDAWWPALGVAVIAVGFDAAPWLGADVGGILSLVPALGLLLVLLAGRRLNWRTVGVAAGAAVAILAGVVAYEAIQPASERDHIGRFFLGGGGQGSFWTTIGRKLTTNISVLTASTWTYLIPLVAVFVVVVLRHRKSMRRLLPRRSVARAGFIGLITVALAGYAMNDSGAVVAALVSVYLGVYVALLALADEVPDDVLLEPIEADPVASGAM
ncbi:MAG TPA: glycosyltransferase [Acidimicrobiales bacterium]|nr:glycosyltransferase [Acidimicrobiales bacterium]